MSIRPSRSFENFSRGLEVIRAIHMMWDEHNRLPAGSNETINRNIENLMGKFDLTLDEWFYWAKLAHEAKKCRSSS